MTIYTHVVYWIHLHEHTDHLTQGYIGVTNNLKRRISEHMNVSVGNGKNRKFINMIRVHSEEMEVTTIFHGDKSQCYLLEEQLRPVQNIGWNANRGGVCPPDKTGWKPSEETLRKRSAALTGLSRTETWKKNLSAAKSGEKNGMFGLKKPCPRDKKISIIKTKNEHRVDKLQIVFVMLHTGSTIRDIANAAGLATSTIIAIKKRPDLYMEAFPILSESKTG